MVSLGLLASSSYSDCVLVNTSTSATNISYTRPGGTEQNDGVFKLDGVISWKECVSLPKIFAFLPPSWLWHVTIRKGYRYLAPINRPMTTNGADRQVMEHYDRVMGSKIQCILNTTPQQTSQMELVRPLGDFALEGKIEKPTTMLYTSSS